MERFLENHDKSVVQVGAWLRRFQSLKHLPLTEYRKICLDTGETGRGYQELEEGFSGVYNEDGIEAVGDYEVRSWLPHNEYDDLLSRNIVFLDLYDSSANNVIVECIRRNTPVMVNPLPAVESTLGTTIRSISTLSRKRRSRYSIARTSGKRTSTSRASTRGSSTAGISTNLFAIQRCTGTSPQ